MECSRYTKATSEGAVPQSWQQLLSHLGHYHTRNVGIYTPRKWGLCEDRCLMWVWPSVQGHSQLVATHSQLAAWMNTWTSPSRSPFFPLAETKRNQRARELLNTFTWAPSRIKREESESAWSKGTLQSTKKAMRQCSIALEYTFNIFEQLTTGY